MTYYWIGLDWYEIWLTTISVWLMWNMIYCWICMTGIKYDLLLDLADWYKIWLTSTIKNKSNCACWSSRNRTSSSSHWKLACSRPDLAEYNHSLIMYVKCLTVCCQYYIQMTLICIANYITKKNPLW
jgi:hypothetical protein